MHRHFPALYVFLDFLDLMSAKCTFFQTKRVRHFRNHVPEPPPISLFSARTPKSKLCLGNILYLILFVT